MPRGTRQPPAASDEASRPSGPEPPPAPRQKPSGEFEIDVEEFAASKRGYDEFISEFRKEIAKLEGALPAEEQDQTKHSSSGSIDLKEVVEPPAPDGDIRALGDRLIDSVTQMVARELAAKIDTKVIYSLIESKLKEVGKVNPKS